jgi:3-carboxy-cis,cis-muconate cycloisomerase
VWLDGFHRAFLRLEHAARAASVLQLGGAVGTLAALGPRGPRVAGAMAAALKLSLPDIPWHASRDRVVDVGAALGLVCGALGKLARDVSLMAQTEVAEVSEGNPPGEGGSSTLPHKQNPVSCAVALQAAHRAPGLVATLLSAMPQEHERGLGGWQAEWETLPELFRITAGSLQRMARLLETLQVDASRMRADLDATGGLALAEAVSMALARTLGKAQAHAHVERASRKAVDDGAAFVSVLRADADIVNALGAELDALLEPESYLGSSDAFIDAVLARRETDERRRSV